ncbi:hypothetical protein [Streptomyces sp. NPDC005485]|uniref:hypothetical protein n=1 Tax=Streptomyces sp. NPDC005485 TaxID=3155591 RepID=UPI0033A7F090
MARNVFGSILALVGATAAVWSPFRAWYDGRHGRSYRLGDLFSSSGVTDVRAGLFASLFLPLVIAGVITLAGVLVQSRVLVALAGVIVLGFTVLWMVRVGQAEGSLSVDSDGDGLGLGVAMAFGGGVLLLVAAALLRGRGRRREPLPPEPSEPTAPPLGAPPPEPGTTTPPEDQPTATWRRPPQDHT